MKRRLHTMGKQAWWAAFFLSAMGVLSFIGLAAAANKTVEVPAASQAGVATSDESSRSDDTIPEKQDQRGKQPNMDAAATLNQCIAAQEKLQIRLQDLRSRIAAWRQQQQQKVADCRRELEERQQQAIEEAKIWKDLVAQTVERWIAQNASREKLGLLRCENLDEPYLEMREGEPVLVLSGQVRDPVAVKEQFEELEKVFSGLRIDAEALEGAAGQCIVAIGRAQLDEGMTIPLRDYEQLPVSALSTLPTRQDCETGRAGQVLQQVADAGRLRVEGGEVGDFWINNNGDFALCIRDNGGWYVRDAELAGFVGLFLGRE